MAPTISSARVLRAGPGMDSTISWTPLDSVAGKLVSGCGSRAPSGVWSDTRNMGTDARRRRLHPRQTPQGRCGLETPVGLTFLQLSSSLVSLLLAIVPI